MKYSILIILVLVSVLCTAQVVTISPSELEQMTGQWEGTLTYTDYRDDTATSTLKCKMNGAWTGKKGIINIGFTEPNGEVIYDKSSLKLLKQGKRMKFENKVYEIDSFEQNENSGGWELSMSRSGKDNNRKAKIKQRISYSATVLAITKEVKYDNTANFFVRNTYLFKRP